MTDGTPDGTILLKDIYRDAHEPCDVRIEGGVSLGGRYLFSARDELGCEPWVTDGTPAGTMRLLDVVPGPGDSYPNDFTLFKGAAYFTAHDPEPRRRIWKTDGTSAGTQPVSGRLLVSALARQFTPLGDWLYFVGADASLWRTDGTEGSEARIHDLFVEVLHVLVGELFLITRDSATGTTLFKMDALDELVEVAEIAPTSRFIVDALGTSDELHFVLQESDARTLWRTDGTATGTQQLTELDAVGELSLLGDVGGRFLYLVQGEDALELRSVTGPGDDALVVASPTCASCDLFDHLQLDGLAYFVAAGGERSELWRTDGTPAGTRLVKGSCCGAAGYSLGRLGADIVFAGSDEVAGTEPWITDGTVGGTRLLADINRTTLPAWPGLFTDADGTMFFSTNEPRRMSSLWTSDGTASGTAPVRELRVHRMTSLGGLAVLSAHDETAAPWELWVSDGTPGGTQEIRVPGSGALEPGGLTDVGGLVYFSGLLSPLTGREPWTTDGTVAGTSMLADLARVDSSPLGFTRIGDTVYFSAGSFWETGRELWKTDGTWPGTELVIDLSPGVAGDVDRLTALADDICFVSGSRSGPGLWCSDGTAPGTRRVRESSTLEDLQAVGDTLYFIDRCDSERYCMYRSDGTEAGTALLRDFERASLASVAVLDGVMYFAAGEGAWDLWRTDGTPAGTFVLRPVSSCDADPMSFAQAHGLFFFAALVEGDREVWASDGTPVGTLPLAGRWSHAHGLAPSGTHVYFTGDDGHHGGEPWAIDLDPDGDGVAGASDNCPQDSNPSQLDADGDGHGDACDACAPGEDADLDNACDAVDNCPSTFNPLQRDLDGDGAGDACEADADGDGADATADCDDGRPGRRVLAEVADLGVTRDELGLLFTWTDQSATAGADVRYSFVGGPLPDGPWPRDELSRATCLASEVEGAELRTFVPGSWWFLARSRFPACSSCGPGTFGDSSVLPDPRDELERVVDPLCR